MTCTKNKSIKCDIIWDEVNTIIYMFKTMTCAATYLFSGLKLGWVDMKVAMSTSKSWQGNLCGKDWLLCDLLWCFFNIASFNVIKINYHQDRALYQYQALHHLSKTNTIRPLQHELATLTSCFVNRSLPRSCQHSQSSWCPCDAHWSQH